jgi:hypothetical protein
MAGANREGMPAGNITLGGNRALLLMAAATVALALALVLALAAAPRASAASDTNTFSYTCTKFSIAAEWDPPLRGDPIHRVLDAVLSGGSCSGTVNGEKFENEPLTGHVVLPGIHACEAGDGDGRGVVTMHGHNLYFNAHYRRVGRDAVLLWTGDTSGQGLNKVYGAVGYVPADSPLANLPIADMFTEDVWIGDFSQACLKEGFRRLYVYGDVSTSTLTMSSPAFENRPDNPTPVPGTATPSSGTQPAPAASARTLKLHARRCTHTRRQTHASRARASKKHHGTKHTRRTTKAVCSG